MLGGGCSGAGAVSEPVSSANENPSIRRVTDPLAAPPDSLPEPAAEAVLPMSPAVLLQAGGGVSVSPENLAWSRSNVMEGSGEGLESVEDDVCDISGSEDVVMHSHQCMRETGDALINDMPDVPKIGTFLRRRLAGEDVDQVLTIRKWLSTERVTALCDFVENAPKGASDERVGRRQVTSSLPCHVSQCSHQQLV